MKKLIEVASGCTFGYTDGAAPCRAWYYEGLLLDFFVIHNKENTLQ
jgi:hypothetical protein